MRKSTLIGGAVLAFGLAGYVNGQSLIVGGITPYGVTGPGPRVILVGIPPFGSLVGGGLAVDRAGNLYVSDFAAGEVLMLPASGGNAVTVVRGLNSPSDIEVSPDGRSLVIAQPDGQVVRRHFGVSIRPLAQAGLPASAVGFLYTDTSWQRATLSADGYFHFPDVLGPLQQSHRFHFKIKVNAVEWNFYDQPFQVVDGLLHGHTVMDIAF